MSNELKIAAPTTTIKAGYKPHMYFVDKISLDIFKTVLKERVMELLDPTRGYAYENKTLYTDIVGVNFNLKVVGKIEDGLAAISVKYYDEEDGAIAEDFIYAEDLYAKTQGRMNFDSDEFKIHPMGIESIFRNAFTKIEIYKNSDMSVDKCWFSANNYDIFYNLDLKQTLSNMFSALQFIQSSSNINSIGLNIGLKEIELGRTENDIWIYASDRTTRYESSMNSNAELSFEDFVVYYGVDVLKYLFGDKYSDVFLNKYKDSPTNIPSFEGMAAKFIPSFEEKLSSRIEYCGRKIIYDVCTNAIGASGDVHSFTYIDLNGVNHTIKHEGMSKSTLLDTVNDLGKIIFKDESRCDFPTIAPSSRKYESKLEDDRKRALGKISSENKAIITQNISILKTVFNQFDSDVSKSKNTYIPLIKNMSTVIGEKIQTLIASKSTIIEVNDVRRVFFSVLEDMKGLDEMDLTKLSEYYSKELSSK